MRYVSEVFKRSWTVTYDDSVFTITYQYGPLNLHCTLDRNSKIIDDSRVMRKYLMLQADEVLSGVSSNRRGPY